MCLRFFFVSNTNHVKSCAKKPKTKLKMNLTESGTKYHKITSSSIVKVKLHLKMILFPCCFMSGKNLEQSLFYGIII